MIFHLLTLLFVGLKLTGYIAWSWWLVLLPSILVFLIAIMAILISLVVAYRTLYA